MIQIDSNPQVAKVNKPPGLFTPEACSVPAVYCKRPTPVLVVVTTATDDVYLLKNFRDE